MATAATTTGGANQEDELLIKKSSSGNLWESVMKEIESRSSSRGSSSILSASSRPVSVIEQEDQHSGESPPPPPPAVTQPVPSERSAAPRRPPRKKRPPPPPVPPTGAKPPQHAALERTRSESMSNKNVRNDLERILEGAFTHEEERNTTSASAADRAEDDDEAECRAGTTVLAAKDRSTSFLSVNDLDTISYCSNFTDDGSLDDLDDDLGTQQRRPASGSVNLGATGAAASPSHHPRRRVSLTNGTNNERRIQKVRGKLKSKAAAGKEKMGALLDAANSAAGGRFKRIKSIRNKGGYTPGGSQHK